MYNMAVFELKHSENWVQFASLSSGGRDSNFSFNNYPLLACSAVVRCTYMHRLHIVYV